MARAFTHYWKNSTWERNDHLLRHTASNLFKKRGVDGGDRIFIVTVKAGQLYVGCALRVDRVVGRREAQKLFGGKVWQASDHIIAKNNQMFYKNFRVPLNTVRALRFEGGKSLIFKQPGELDQQTLRGVRELTAESADLLEALLGSARQKVKPKSPPSAAFFPDEIEPDKEYVEGARTQITVNGFERDLQARKACLKKHGFGCAVCAFDFEKRYGRIGKEFIHVHHLKPIALTDGEYELDPVADLRPVCPNCHAMLHRAKTLLSIEKLRAML